MIVAWIGWLICFPTVSFAWGKLGHEIVGNLAWALLSTTTQNSLSNLLNISATNHSSSSSTTSCSEFCSPLAIVADWADQVRYTKAYHWTAPLHYIDVHDKTVPGGCPANRSNSMPWSNGCQFVYTRDCANDRCVAGAINNYTQQLLLTQPSSKVPPRTTRLEQQQLRRDSLKFLIHFVGDIHQPLHCSRQSDTGGNSIHVKFLNQTMLHLLEDGVTRDYHSTSDSTPLSHAYLHNSQYHHHNHELNLHSVWDSTILETALNRGNYSHSRNAVETDLLDLIWHTRTTPTWYQNWLRCGNGQQQNCTIQWGEESWWYAIHYAYRNVDDTEIRDGTNLTEVYYQTRWPVIQERLAVAGVRLAATLEIIFGDGMDLTYIGGTTPAADAVVAQ